MANVLIVDHQSSIRKLLTSSLSGDGYKVDEATSEKAALEMAAKSRFDLIFLNIDGQRTPDGDGILRHNPATVFNRESYSRRSLIRGFRFDPAEPATSTL